MRQEQERERPCAPNQAAPVLVMRRHGCPCRDHGTDRMDGDRALSSLEQIFTDGDRAGA